MKLPKVNCKCYDDYGSCNKLPRKFFGLFKADCVEITFKKCGIKEIKFIRPSSPPLPPKKLCYE